MAQEINNLSFLTGINAEYVVHLYGEYLKNPAKVDASWKTFFSGLSDDELIILKEMQGASWTPEENRASSRAFGKTTSTALLETGAGAGGKKTRR
ncbi:MAG: hypothetical protein LRZ85_09955 [Alphaproteobacteria bacterium]|nr:hypothetical protein [Alphaproteobacteria bacterium]